MLRLKAPLLIALAPLLVTTAMLSAVPVARAADARPYVEQKLDSGLDVISMESHKVPLVTIVLAAKAGAMTETQELNGLTHLWEHMFFKGNARLPNQEAFNKRIRQLGISYNGDTAAEKVRYFITLPAAFLGDGLQFIADAISTPLLQQQELERERRVVLNEYERNAAQPSFDFTNLQRAIVYGPLGYLRDPLGLRPTIEKATREQMLKIKDQVFVPSNCALLVAGDFVKADLLRLIKRHFADWHNPPNWQPLTPPPFPPFPTASTPIVMTRPDVQNAHVGSLFLGPKARTEAKATYPLDVLVNLVEHRNGKFYRKFVDSGLTYEAAVSYYTQSQAGEIEVSAATEPKHATEVQKALLAELPALAQPGYFTASQLADVKRKLRIGRKLEQNQPTEFIKELAFWWAVTGLDYYDNYLTNIDRVTLSDVTATATRWLVGKPHLDAILLSPADAAKVGLQDNSGPLVDKYLSQYKNPQTAPSKG